MKSSFIPFMMLLVIFSFTSCTKDIPTPTNDLVTAKTAVVITPANPAEKNYKDDNAEAILTIKVTDNTDTPVSDVSVYLEGNQIYSFETNNEGEDEKVIETGNYTLSVENGNIPLTVLETTYNEGILTIQIQE